MTILEAIILGIVQGLTEFLPVSSSGHLVLGKAVLGIEIENIAFEVFVHLGTLLAVLTLFWKDIIILLKGVRAIVLLRFNTVDSEEKTGLQLLLLLFLGTIPAATLGYIFKDTFESTFQHPEFVCGALLVTGLLLTASRWSKSKGKEISKVQAFGTGVAQVAAIFPGISRSGTTISTAMLLGVERNQAARFSFLLAIPLIIAASLLQALDLVEAPPASDEIIALIVGTIAAYFSGLFAIKWLLAVVKEGTFSRFAYYCFAVGGIGLVYFLMN